MMYLGEIISLFVALLWTVTALAADGASRRIGSLTVNIFRMLLSLVFLGATLWVFTGSPVPVYADGRAWFWLSMSGLVGYVFGDYCLFNCYVLIGSRFGQLFMTLAPVFAAISGWMFLGEVLTLKEFFAMLVTLSGIGISVLVRAEGEGKKHRHLELKLPLKGVLLGIGAGLGQGVGLVLSKIGMNYYESCVPADATENFMDIMPFASTFIRAITGAVGFIGLAMLQKSLGSLSKGLRDRKAMGLVALTTFMGPFLGVSFSLMAVRYANAGVASTLMALVPALIIIPHALIYRQKVQAKEVIGTFISLAGVAMFFI